MSTRNIPDDELDEFFKKSSENFPTEIAPGAWQQMEKKLNQAYRRTMLLRTSLAVLVAAGLVLLLVLTGGKEGTATGDQQKESAPGFSVSPSQHPGALPAEGNKAIGNTPSVPSPQAKVSSPASSSPAPGLLPGPTNRRREQGQASENNRLLAIKKAGNKVGTSIEKTKATSSRKAIRPEPAAGAGTPADGRIINNPNQHLAGTGPGKEPGAPPTEERMPSEEKATAGENSAVRVFTKPPAESKPDLKRESLSPGAAEETIGPAGVGTEALTGKEEEMAAPAANSALPAPADSAELRADNPADPMDLEKPVQRSFRFSLQAVVGPDLSSVGFPRPGQPGTNLGVLLEYHLSPRISLSGGLLHGTKVYQAGKYDYSPASKIWTYGVKPDRIDAVCAVIDLPLNVRFTAFRSGRSRLFATTGLSTFLMRDERYSYTYSNPNPHLIGSWRVKNGSRHPFSVYNLSVGYERELTERFSLQAEPFVKVPLGGVGFGQVKLTSVGLFFSARYHFRPR